MRQKLTFDDVCEMLSQENYVDPDMVRADLERYGGSDKVSANAYVSRAITTVARHSLGG